MKTDFLIPNPKQSVAVSSVVFLKIYGLEFLFYKPKSDQ